MKKIFKILGIIIVIIAIIIIVLFVFFNKGFGLGGGMYPGTGDAGTKSIPAVSTKEETVDDSIPAVAEEPDTKEDNGEDIPDTIIVKISEDTVTVNDQPVSNEDELRDKINEYNSDERSFELEDDYATLDIYNRVKNVFDELEIFLSEE